MKRLDKDFDPDVTLFELVSALESGIWSRAKYLFEQLEIWNDTGGHLPDLRHGSNKAEGGFPRRNPSLVTYANPSESGALMSEHVHQVRYRHAENDKDYFHDFADGVAMIALDNGTILLKSDKILWEDFD